MAYTITTYIEKGGVTKTTSTVHIAQACSRKGLRVLVVDLDAQGHATRWLQTAEPALTINEAVRRPETVSSCIVPSRIQNVDLLPGSRKLALSAESILKQDEDGNPRDSFRVLDRLLEVAGANYDLILVDCSPSVSLLSSNAIVAADHILIPTDLADLGFDGISRLATTLAQMVRNGLLDRVPQLTVLLSLVESEQTKTTAEIHERIAEIAKRENAPYTVLSNTIRYRRQMKGIFNLRQTAFDLSDTGQFRWKHLKGVASDYNAVAAELVGMIVAARKERASA